MQIPVGCGKTGIMATLPFGIAQGRTLVITPISPSARASPTLWTSLTHNVLDQMPGSFDFTAGPWMAILDGPNANIHDAIESDFVVCNIQQLASQADRWLPRA